MKFDPSLPEDGINVSPAHPLREVVVLVAGVGAALAGLALAIAVAVDWIVPRVPPSWEARLFAGDWLSPGEGAGPADPRTDAVQALLDRLARHWPEAPFPFRASVLAEDAPNAFAFPGGRVLVTTGLLDRVGSENELAFVLGHELGHFANRDHLRGLGRGLALTLVLSAVGLANGGDAGRLAGLAVGFSERSFSRRQERAADAFGLARVADEYGHVASAWDFFSRLPEPGAVERRLATYLATHPLSDDRIDDLRARARAAGYETTGPLTAFGDGS